MSPHRRMASTSSSRTSSRTTINQETTQLSYRMGNEDDSRERQELHRKAVEGSDSPPRKWLWTGTQVPSEQMLLDKYLENIDRRYHRLHDDDKAGSISWTWNWLMAQPSQPQGQEEDALRVLELADLASERLLKQHKRKQKKPTPVVDVVVSEERPSFWTALQKRKTIVTLATRRTVHKMLRRSTQAMTKAPSSLVASVLSLSGAKKTGLVILSLLVFLLKPITQA